MKIVLAPDSYKGSITAAQVCRIVKQVLEQELLHADIVSIPMADGGEGTVEAIVSANNGRKLSITTSGPLGLPIESFFGDIHFDSEQCAVIEVASLFGLPMLTEDTRNPLNTTSRGLGEAIHTVLNKGYRKLFIGLGGSSTNDGGMGMLSALGAKFYDSNGKELLGIGRDLFDLYEIDLSGLDKRLLECTIIAGTDVTNPLLGLEGATQVYGPQKGAHPEMITRLEEAMGNYANLLEDVTLTHHQNNSGAGAAGGIGFALMTIGAQIQSGAQLVGMLSGLDKQIQGADIVLTGEGSSDAQTLYGKLPIYVASRARAAGKKTILLSGSLGHNWESLIPHFDVCFSTVTSPTRITECMMHAERNLRTASRNVAKMLSMFYF